MPSLFRAPRFSRIARHRRPAPIWSSQPRSPRSRSTSSVITHHVHAAEANRLGSHAGAWNKPGCAVWVPSLPCAPRCARSGDAAGLPAEHGARARIHMDAERLGRAVGRADQVDPHPPGQPLPQRRARRRRHVRGPQQGHLPGGEVPTYRLPPRAGQSDRRPRARPTHRHLAHDHQRGLLHRARRRLLHQAPPRQDQATRPGPWTSSARWATPSPSTPWRQPGKGESSRQTRKESRGRGQGELPGSLGASLPASLGLTRRHRRPRSPRRARGVRGQRRRRARP